MSDKVVSRVCAVLAVLCALAAVTFALLAIWTVNHDMSFRWLLTTVVAGVPAFILGMVGTSR